MGAANIKGISIQIDGQTTELQKSLKDVDSALKATQNSLRDVNKLLKLDPKNTELLAQKQKLLKDAIGQTEDRLQKLKSAQGQVAQGTAEWDGLQREIIETEQKLKGLETQYKQFGSVAGQQIKAVGKDMQELGSKIEAAGRAFAPISAAGGAVLTGMGALGYKAATAADELNTLSKQTGISTDELQKMQYASNLVDVSVEDITGSMKKMKNNMDSSSKSVTEAWAKIGVSTRNADGSMRNATDVFYEALEGLSKIENETERDQVAMDLFGKSADNLAGIIDDGGAALKEYGQQAEDMGLIMSGDTLNSLNAINDTIDQTKATVGASLLELGATIATTFQPMIEKAAQTIGTIAEKIRELDPSTIQLIATIAAVVAAIAPVLIIGGKIIGGIGTIVTHIGGLVGFIQGTVLPAIGAISAPVIAVVAIIGTVIAALVLLYQHNEDFRNKVNDIWEQVKQTISMAVEAIHAAIEAFISLAQAAWERWGDDILRVAQTIWNLIFTVIQTVLTLIQDVIRIVMAVIHGDWSAAWEGIKQLASDLWDGIKQVVDLAINAVKTTVDTVMELVKGIWETAWGAIRDKLSEIWETIKQTVTDLATEIQDRITEVKDTIIEKVGEAVDYLKDLPGKALQWGKDLIDNFVGGIKDGWDTLKGGVEWVADGIADFLQFSEPDKGPLSNFHTWAPDMMKLYAEGIRDNMYLVTDQMNALASQMAVSASRTANIQLVNNTVLNGRVIASAVNEELGFLL